MIEAGALRGSFGRLLFASPLYGALLAGRTPAALKFQPQSPFAGNALSGAALVRGRLPLGDDRPGIELGYDWLPHAVERTTVSALHGFGWLADLRAQGGDDARRRARDLVASWLDAFPSWHETAWSADLLGRRVYNWLAAYEFFAGSADEQFRARVMRSLMQQAKHLARQLPAFAQGLDRIAGLKALAVAGLALPGREAWVDRALRLTLAELERQLLPDGGHASRNPSSQLEFLRHLIELRAALSACEREPPAALERAIDKAAMMLRLVRHGDGRLAQFNGGCEEAREEVEQVLAQARQHGRAPIEGPDWGYDRLASGRTLLLVDTGRPPAMDHAVRAHAGPLSFELSVGRERLIVNAGGKAGASGALGQVQRTTAAHSTLVVDDTNAIELLPQGFGRVMTRFTRSRAEAEGRQWLDAAHDGYRFAFGLMHRRRLFVEAGGDDIRGEDTLVRVGDGRRQARSCVVRFHLHPSVRAALVDGGKAALLRLPGGGGFRLNAAGSEIELGDSIYLGGPGAARPTQQLSLNALIGGAGTPGEVALALRWALRRVARETPAS